VLRITPQGAAEAKSCSDAMMYDYRGYGKSTGERSEATLHRDAQHLYDFLKKQFSEDFQ